MTTQLLHHLDKLTTLTTLVEAGSLQGAARTLSTTAPALSYALKQLEEATGVILFQRSRRGLQLTPKGQVVYRLARQILLQVHDMQSQLLESPDEVKRTLRVGTFPSIALYLLPKIKQALSSADQLRLHVATNRSQRILEDLVAGDLDLTFTVGRIKHANVIHHRIYGDFFSLYISAKQFQGEDFSDPSKWTLIYMPDATDRNQVTLQAHIRSWSQSFAELFELDSFEVIASLIANGMGVGILPERVATASPHKLNKIKVQGVPERFAGHDFFMSYRKDSLLRQKLVSKFLESAKTIGA